MLITVIKKILHWSQEKPFILFPALGCSLISAVLALSPAVAAYFVLLLREQGSLHSPAAWYMAAGTVLALCCRYGFALAAGLMSHKAGNIIVTGLRQRLLEQLGGLSAKKLSSYSQGRLKKIITDDVNQVDVLFSHHLPDLVSAVATPLLIGAVLFFIDWRMALAALAPLPLALWVQAGSARIVQQGDVMRNYGAAQSLMNTAIVEFIRGAPVFKIFNQSMGAYPRLQESIAKYREMQKTFLQKLSGRWGVFLALVTIPHVPLGVLGIWLFSRGELALPQFVLFLILGPLLLAPIAKFMRIGAIISMLNGVLAELEPLFESREDSVQALPPEEAGRINGSAGGGHKASSGRSGYTKHDGSFVGGKAMMTLKDVCFSYRETPVFENFSCTIPAGNFIAVVGPSGSGKSTLAALLAGIEQPDSGSVYLGTADMRHISKKDVSRAVSIFLQDAFIFTGSVKENIALARPDLSSDLEGDGMALSLIIKAARCAHCHDQIMAMPNGYDTIIGEGGQIHLSGGEKQRIALARCVLRETPILIMDEATSAMDAENESKIQAALAELTATQALIVITHRIYTVAKADHIIVLDKGRVSGQGTHTTLYGHDPVYTAMWDAGMSAKEWKLATGKQPVAQRVVA